jgi:predicted RNase H-like HicB family nuclease
MPAISAQITYRLCLRPLTGGILYEVRMILTIEFDQEVDGRWIAEIPQLPGVLAYGDTQNKAAQMARALAFRVLADQIESGEVDASSISSVSFAA